MGEPPKIIHFFLVLKPMVLGIPPIQNPAHIIYTQYVCVCVCMFEKCFKEGKNNGNGAMRCHNMPEE